MIYCYLVRHGRDDETVRGGWAQHPLTDEGARQARKLAVYIENHAGEFEIKHLYSSDLRRAMETAEPIGEKLGLPILPLPKFREVNNGELAGMNNDLAKKLYPGLFWNALEWEQEYPDGESPRQFYERIEEAWNDFQREIISSGENVLLVTHGGVIRAILRMIRGKPCSNKISGPAVKHAEMIALRFKDGKWERE